MSEPKCPDCKHPVNQHSDFFCMHVKCDCNQGKDTARAKYERDVYKKRLELAKEGLKSFSNGWEDKVMDNALYYLGEIEKIGE